jgi:hypothetical protein
MLFAHDLSDLASPAEAGFAKAGNRFPLFGIMLYLRMIFSKNRFPLFGIML